MCDKAADAYLLASKFVADLLFTNKMLEKLMILCSLTMI